MVGRHLCCCCFLFDRALEGWVLSVVVFPMVSSPKGSSSLVLGVSSPKRNWRGFDDAALASGLFLRVSPPKGSWGGRCCRTRQRGRSSFVPRVLSPRGRSLSFLGVFSPKGSWGGVDDAALASRCRTAVARCWAIRLIAANNAVRPMMADAAPGLYTLLLARRRRADVSDLY